MTTFQARRATKEFSRKISASPSEVFPLLCPVREYDWIDGWTCDLIYSDSGVAENNCVFTTKFPRGSEEIWVVSEYDPEKYVIQFVVVNPKTHIMKFDVSLRDDGDNSTTALWRSTFTALTEEGNELIDKTLDETYPAVMTRLSKSLDHYCRTGKMLKEHALHRKVHSALNRL